MALGAVAPGVVSAVRPPLKWAGGKRRLVRRILPLWRPGQHRRLVEPLCGGLSVALSLRPERSLLNDVNPHIINFYRWLKRGLRISIPMKNESSLFYEYRGRFNALVAAGGAGSEEAASLFYYLNRTCYKGLYRFSLTGEFNVPFGRYNDIAYKWDLTEYQTILANWQFRCGDFEELVLEPDDFVYADPPYDVEFTQYVKDGFWWEDQERLARWLVRHSGPVVISNQATERVERLYRALGFKILSLKAPRLISCTGDRTPVDEVLAYRNCAESW